MPSRTQETRARAVRVKVCGITNIEDALAACDAGADALGFNFVDEARKRGRYVEPAAAREIVAALPPFVTSVAVCVNEPAGRIASYLEFLDCVQLHGEETPAYCGPFAANAIKAFRAGPGFEPEQMLAWPAAAYLLDAYVPDSRGGTGKTCDWDVAARAVGLGKPVILAGGLTPENVREAVHKVRPYAVDVAGGVESEPGKKDYQRIRDFIINAKSTLSIP